MVASHPVPVCSKSLNLYGKRQIRNVRRQSADVGPHLALVAGMTAPRAEEQTVGVDIMDKQFSPNPLPAIAGLGVDSNDHGLTEPAQVWRSSVPAPHEGAAVATRPSVPPAMPQTPIVRPRSMQGVIGESPELVELFEVVDRVADTNCTVLITGESGTGKELVARAVHRASNRDKGAFVAVNCGAIPENLLESELFGHARGAFTGAHTSKVGRIGLADKGTLFLDEIGELPLSLQVKLLRVLQAHEYSPVGDTRTLKADVRVVAATNVDLEDAVAKGLFRQDLYYRLNVIHLQVPPLRRRASDIPVLIEYFMRSAAQKTGRPPKTLTRAATQLLATYDWPGNVRELENTIERAMLLSSGDRIEPKDLPVKLRGLGSKADNSAIPQLPEAGLDLRAAVESFENDLIRQALDRTGWNKNRAAILLRLNRTTLVEMLKRKRINRAA